MLKDFQTQKGSISAILLTVILLSGIIAGVFLVQKTQIFKPKANELDTTSQDYQNASKVEALNSAILYTQFENGPSKITGNSPEKYQTLRTSADKLGYGVNVNESQSEVTVTFYAKQNQNTSPGEKEEECKNALVGFADEQSGAGKHYLEILGHLLANEQSTYFSALPSFNIPFTNRRFTTNPTETPQIDPWFAMCKYIPASKLEELGFTRTILYGANGEGRDKLNCDDQPPTKDQLGIFPYTGNPSIKQKYAYYQPPACILQDFLDAGLTAREQIDQSNSTYITSIIAKYLIPIFGPEINSLSKIGEGQRETVAEVNLSTALGALFIGLGPAVHATIARTAEVVGISGAVQATINSGGRIVGKYLIKALPKAVTEAGERLSALTEREMFEVLKKQFQEKSSEVVLHFSTSPSGTNEDKPNSPTDTIPNSPEACQTGAC